MIIFGVVGGVSIGKMFLGGFIPGALIGCGLMAVSYFLAKRAGYEREKFLGFKSPSGKHSSGPSGRCLMPLIILGGILGGIFTPTEAAVVAVVYGAIVGFGVYRELRIRDLPKLFAKAAISTSTVMLIIGHGKYFGWILTARAAAAEMLRYLVSLTSSPAVLYALILALPCLVMRDSWKPRVVDHSDPGFYAGDSAVRELTPCISASSWLPPWLSAWLTPPLGIACLAVQYRPDPAL